MSNQALQCTACTCMLDTLRLKWIVSAGYLALGMAWREHLRNNPKPGAGIESLRRAIDIQRGADHDPPRQCPGPHQAVALDMLQRVEQMAAYYEAPKDFFAWIDLQRGMTIGHPTIGAIEVERVKQAERVMPLIRDLLNDWSRLSSDLRTELRDYGIGYHIDAITQAHGGVR